MAAGGMKEKRKRKKFIVIPGEADACPRYGNPMQIREYGDVVVEEQLRASSFYTR